MSDRQQWTVPSLTVVSGVGQSESGNGFIDTEGPVSTPSGPV